MNPNSNSNNSDFDINPSSKRIRLFKDVNAFFCVCGKKFNTSMLLSQHTSMDHSSNSAEPLTGDAERDIVIQEPMIDNQVVSNAMNVEEGKCFDFKIKFQFLSFT